MAADHVTDVPLLDRLNGLRLPPEPTGGAGTLDPGTLAGAALAGLALAALVILVPRLLEWRKEARFAALVSEAFGVEAEQARLARLAQVLRRVALSRADGRESMALSGGAWLDWLETRTRTGFFANGPGEAFGEALYAPPDRVDWAGLREGLPKALSLLYGGRHARLR
jgi:hypothetical protein